MAQFARLDIDVTNTRTVGFADADEQVEQTRNVNVRVDVKIEDVQNNVVCESK